MWIDLILPDQSQASSPRLIPIDIYDVMFASGIEVKGMVMEDLLGTLSKLATKTSITVRNVLISFGLKFDDLSLRLQYFRKNKRWG